MMTVTQPAKIDPDAIYDDRAICLAIRVSPASLARGRRDGTLRYTRQGHRNLYFGRWLVAWLDATEVGSHMHALAQ